MIKIYHKKKIEDIFKELKTSYRGLSEEDAKSRLQEYGLNEIKEKKKVSPLKIFFSQFKNFIIGILFVALVISLIIGENLDAIIIGIILILNAVFGFIQEYKAEKAIEALKKLASLKATVIRENKRQEIDAATLVPGDIILLETGDKIPADSRLIEIVNLETQESSLTGESTPITKDLKILPEKTPIADQKNMVFSGTIVTKGRAKAIVVQTGMNSQIGKIATLIEEEETKPTPLQIKLKQLGKLLGIATIFIVIIVFFAGILTGKETIEMFIAAVSLAVAAIPEGLPAVVTISLALGVQRMVKRHALVRKLPSVETLGSTTVICTDKTGTLTCDQMTVRKIYVNNKIIEVTGSGYETKGVFLINNKIIDPKPLNLLLKIGTLCNDASLTEDGIIGDPTEAALIVSAAKASLLKSDLEKKNPRINELGFDSERKRMSTLHKMENKKIMYCKGAPDIILELCDRIIINEKISRLTRPLKKQILKQNDEFANEALRVLGFAYKETSVLEEKNLIFVGLQAMIDPPRPQVKDAIEKCKKAGIKVVMITGDHKNTAMAIAKEIGIEGEAITGQDLDEIKDFEKKVETIAIYARVDPEHKSKIIDALRKKGHIIAMTGDGVNDAPALKKADIGIAMSITGTDVSKEASAMVLTDDNFASIVNAVEEGRGIYDNIKKFVEYLLSSNLGEILTIFIGIMLGWPLPLIAIQILWVNLATDGLPALALGVDPVDPNIMSRLPRKPKEKVLSNHIIARMFIVGIIMMIGTLGIFKLYNPESNLRYAQTMAFTTLMMFQMFNVLNCRSEQHSLFKIGIFSNKYLVVAILSSILLQILVIHTGLSKFFKTVPLSITDWVYIILVSSTVLIVIEIIKLIQSKVKWQA